MYYRVSVNSGLAWPYSNIVTAFSEQEAVDKTADELEKSGSAFVTTYDELLEQREPGQSAEEYAEANNLICCGNHGIYMGVVSIEKLPFTEAGETAYSAVELLKKEERLEWAKKSAANLAAYHLFEDQERAYGVVDDIRNSTYLSSKEPYCHLTFGPMEVLKELEYLLLSEAIPERIYKLPVTWEVCGYVNIKASSIPKAIEKFKEFSEGIELPQNSSYVDGSFNLATEDESIISLYNQI